MEKAFKYMCIFMSAVIILSSFCMVFAAAFGRVGLRLFRL